MILATPTGSGKSLVATAAHFEALGRRSRASFYTAPIKALVNEKFFALCDDFGADDVGMLTGDASVNRDAPIICCTAEVLANIALREGRRADVGLRGDGRVPLLRRPRPRHGVAAAAARAADSALPADVGHPRRRHRAREPTSRGAPGARPPSSRTPRPVPLDFDYALTPLDETLEELVRDRAGAGLRRPLHPGGRGRAARRPWRRHLHGRGEGRARGAASRRSGSAARFGKTLQKLLRRGIGVHHAGHAAPLPPAGGDGSRRRAC